MPNSRNIIAIGGGGFGANPGQGIIENYILKQTKKKNPSICFIPTATGDNEAYKVNFYSTFTNLDCRPSHLDFFKRTPDLNELILNQDAIFVGGGNTKSMLVSLFTFLARIRNAEGFQREKRPLRSDVIRHVFFDFLFGLADFVVFLLIDSEHS